MSMLDVNGARNSAPSVAAAPTVAYAGAEAILKKLVIACNASGFVIK